MNRLRILPLLLCGLLLSTIALSQEKYSRVKVFGLSNTTERANVLGLLEIDHFTSHEDGSVESTISARALNQLKRSGYRYEILIDDESAYFVEQSKLFFEQNKNGIPDASIRPNLMGFEQSCQSLNTIIPTPSLFSTNGLPPGAMGGYYTYTEMVSKIDQLVSLYPGLVQKLNIGTSIEGRTIWAVKISDNVSTDEAEPEVLFTALQHAREAITGTSMIFFMQYLCQNYAGNVSVQEVVNSREIYIVPCVNPDGYVRNQTTNPSGGGMVRKNRRNNNATNPGVDLNRNYGVDWGNCAGATTSCGSNVTTDDTYYGTAAFSEPETQAIRNLVQSRYFTASIDQHCFGPYYSLPFGRPSLHTMTPLDKKFYVYIPGLMGKYNGMRAGNSPESVNYEVAGGIKDWLLLGDIGTGTKGKIYGMTGEGGGGGFWAPSAQIISLCKGMTFQNIQLALTAGSYFDIQDNSDIALTSLTGNFNFKLLRVGVLDKPVTVSIVRVENVYTTGAPVVVNSMPNYYDAYNGSIAYTLYPGIPNGTRVKFVWKVESDGITTYDSVTKIYNPITLVSDDMESGVVGTKWTVSGGFGYSNDLAFGGSRSLAESPNLAKYTASSTRTAQSVTNLDLTGATAAYVSFWVRHRSENFRDKLQVQVSPNGTTWTPVCGKNTVQENNDDGSQLNSQPALTGWRPEWYQELYDISSFTGNANLRFRFVFTSDNDPTAYAYELDSGFNIDNFKAIKTMTVLQNRLPVNFVNVKGKLVGTNAIQVDWEAYTDAQHDYFEVEKSTDGSNFKSIGRVNGQPPYGLLDREAVVGNNYYRIKQYDKDGAINYSRVVVVVNNPRVKLSIYPNPVTDDLKIKVDNNRASTLTVMVTDMQGRLVFNKNYNEFPGSGTITVNTLGWTPQVYQLKVTNNRGELVTIQKFVKQ